MTSTAEIGKRLARLRGEISADPAIVAHWARISPARLAEIEAGAPSIGATEFERLCRALGIDPAALDAGVETSPTRSVARFRSAWGAELPFQPRDYRLLADAAEAGRILGDLCSRLGKPPRLAQHRRTTALSSTQEPWEQGYALGEAARSALSDPSAVLPSVESLLNTFGVHVARVQFSTDHLEAASIWESGSIPVILLNRAASRVSYDLSRRAVLCHELCHLLHDAGEGEIATRTTWGEETRSRNDGVEKRAGGFAPAFLAPRREVIRWFDQQAKTRGQDPAATAVELANHFGLSFEGAVWHAKNCGVIASADCDRIARTYTARRGELDQAQFETTLPTVPPAMFNPLLPERARDVMDGWGIQVVVEALEKELITAGRASEILESE